MYRSSLFAVSTLALFVSLNGSARAISVPAVFDIDEAQSDVSITISAGADSDSDMSSLSGTIESSFTIDPTGGTPLVTGMELTGGRYFLDDPLEFDLTVLSIFNFNLTSNDISGVADTPTPPAPVTSLGPGDLSYEFDASFHDFTFEQGTLAVSGVIDDSFNLADDPQHGMPPVGTMGSIDLVQGETIGNLTNFTARVDVPVNVVDSTDFDIIITTLTVNFEIVGHVIAFADFAVDIGLGDIPGDLDGDGDVDGDDFLAWQTGFGVNDSGDIDGDGDTDGDDFLIWQGNFGSGAGARSGAVPEPTSAALALLLLGLLLASGGLRPPLAG